MQPTFVEPKRKTNAYDAGFRYALQFPIRPRKWYMMLDVIKSQLGQPNYRHQYGIRQYGFGMRLAANATESPWMAGPKRWTAAMFDDGKQPYWILFREEKHRTWASLIIGEYCD